MVPRYAIAALLVSALLACPFAYPDHSIFSRGDQLVAELRQNNFDEAAKLFHYPPSYTAEELSSERASVAGFLRTLFGEIGDIATISRVPPPAGRFLTLGESSGDLPYWSSHPELSKTENVTYRAEVKRDGEVYLVVSFIRPMFAWEVRTITFQLAAARPGAAERMAELTRKLAPAVKPSHKGA